MIYCGCSTPLMKIKRVEPHGKARGTSIVIPSYAKASEGYPSVAKSTEASSFEHMINLAAFYASIHGRARACTTKCLYKPQRKNCVPARRRGLLRRWIRLSPQGSFARVITSHGDTKRVLDRCPRPPAVLFRNFLQTVYGSSMIDGDL